MRVALKVVRESREGCRERYEAELVLVRPDQFVAWASDGSGVDAAAILRKAVGSPGREASR